MKTPPYWPCIMGNTPAKRTLDDSQGSGDGQPGHNIDGSPMDDSGFVFPDHNEILAVVNTWLWWND